MKNRLQQYFVAALLVVFAASCAVTDIDRQYNFNQLSTYAWDSSEVKTDNPVYNSDLIEKNIKTTVDNEFANRGIRYNPERPDFLVSFKTYTEQRERTNASAYGPYGPFMPFGWGYSPYGFGWRPFGLNRTWYNSETYTEGFLIIDIKDAKTKEVVWRGTVSGDVDNVKNLQKQIRKGVEAIMKKAPVPVKDNLNLDGEKPIS